MDIVGIYLLTVGVLLLILIGMPLAVVFLVISISASIFLIGPSNGPLMILRNVFDTLSTFTLVPLPLFIFMAEVLVRSGLAIKTIDALKVIFIKLPARLSIIGACAGALFGFLSGSVLGSVAMLGRMLYPEMANRKYNKQISLGPIMAAGGLAMIIPPSNLAIIYALANGVSVGKLLIANIIPGILLLLIYILYILIYVLLNPSAVPEEKVVYIPFLQRIRIFLQDIVPLMILIFLVTGLLMLGIVTPTEGAAFGAIGSLAVTLLYKCLKWEIFIDSLKSTVKITTMLLFIVAGSVGYSYLLSFSGITRFVVGVALNLPLPSVGLLSLMLFILVFLGFFIDEIGIIMVTGPIYMPILNNLGVDPVWFGVLALIALKVGFTSPPFGLIVFTLKGTLLKEDVTLKELYSAAFPFVVCDLIIIAIVFVLPILAMWLPVMMLN